MSKPLTIAMVAGEASGDQLGGKLITALRERYPQARFCGIGGRHMKAAGFEAWWDRDELSVMGLFEVLKHLPRLLKLRKQLRERLLEARPDVLIGIDAPDFNLGLEKQLKKVGIPTVHYVSPTVWAWRAGRAKKIGKAADLVLCLFPFEPAFYEAHQVQARYTGHPMADEIQNNPDRKSARDRLGLAGDTPLVALLPGSRGSEVSRLAQPMLEAVRGLQGRQEPVRFVAALADERTAQVFRDTQTEHGLPACPVVCGQALDVMAAADVVICASGTATLECMLVNRPMVVIYRLSPSTHWVASTFNLIKTKFISLPNILAQEPLVPELIQEDATGEAIAKEVSHWLDDQSRREALSTRFAQIHDELRQDAASSAATAIADLLATRNG